jgi:hypothetical protein
MENKNYRNTQVVADMLTSVYIGCKYQNLVLSTVAKSFGMSDSRLPAINVKRCLDAT